MKERETLCTPTRSSETPDIRNARAILRGEVNVPPPAALYELAERLKADDRFSHARRILAFARTRSISDESLARELRQRHALCTFKDTDLPAEQRLEAAMRILASGEDLEGTTDQETLGLAGSICKQRWQLDVRREHLELSLHYYRRGHAVGVRGDTGYTSINAAYVLDVLASLEEESACTANVESEIAAARRAEARSIREELVRVLPQLPGEEGREWLAGQWWYHATLIEAHFGLGEYDEAVRCADAAMSIEGVPDWEQRATAVQLASLARVQPDLPRGAEAFEHSRAAAVLDRLLGHRSSALRGASIGKVGLALSGGGFRASFYHIGVLAALAEMDMLRHVEVLSCVSGGSIVGAHYYLELKHLLETKPDDEITREDYIAIVRRLEVAFFEGVTQNIRLRVIGGFASNVRMIFQRDYSRTLKAGELYERFLYSQVADGNGQRPRWLTDLIVRPAGTAGFRPKRDNWRRHAKVPDIIFNATTLNTGHNWQFTASWMGEPPADTDSPIDTNYTLRRMYHHEAPERYRCVRLGHAVAASSCVPGLFEPITLDGLYPGLTVRLVDGGVHDNQGVTALLDQECSVVLVSDASGQMGTEDVPGRGVVGVPLRSNSILMSRVRAGEYDELRERYRSRLLRGLMFVHLKQGLAARTVDWVGCEDPSASPAAPARKTGDGPTDGLPPALLQRLSEIRTDLDAFSEAEAFSLMYAGWRMTDLAFGSPALNWIPKVSAEREPWTFLEIETHLKVPSRMERLMRLLDVGRYRLFRVWRLVRPLRVLAAILGLTTLAGVGALALLYRDRPLVTVGTVASTLIGAALTAVLGPWVMRAKDPGATARRIFEGLALAFAGWLIVGIHMLFFNPLYLRQGTIRER